MVRCSTLEDAVRRSSVPFLDQVGRDAWLWCRNTVGARWPTSPRGRQIMISTMARPNTSMRYCSNSRNSSKPPSMTSAASATPSCEPMPPSTTIASTSADSLKVKHSGLMKPCRVAKNAPAKPPNMAPIANAVSLVVGGVDAERAAGDLVLAQRLPGAADRQPAQPHRHPVGQQRQRQDQVEQEHDAMGRARIRCRRSRRSRLARRRAECRRSVGRGMPVMPFGPPVRLCQLSRTRRMISPNASVTMAR